jgi:Spy/CpxP family protein refolding chaperone
MSLCLIFIVSACEPYYYQEPPPRRPPAPQQVHGDLLYNIERFSHELKLSSPQIQKIRQLRSDFDKESKRIDADLRARYTDLNILSHEDRKQMDRNGLFKKTDEISDLHAEMQRKIIQLDLDITDLLTDEQYEKLKDIQSRQSGSD